MYSSDYLSDTAHLSLVEHGIYIRLLLHYYQHEEPLPANLDKVCRIISATTPEERQFAEHILAQYFELSVIPDGGKVWRHNRAEREISEAKTRRFSNTTKAIHAASIRWGVKDA